MLEGFRLRLGPIIQDENLSGTAAAAKSIIGAKELGVHVDIVIGLYW